ncbi:MAG TPA: hypothetical protein VKZ53_29050 [Candidatus Angelobacter sp.]|nr:hypothetical protein [Candidatus Angelobacter sp.]
MRYVLTDLPHVRRSSFFIRLSSIPDLLGGLTSYRPPALTVATQAPHNSSGAFYLSHSYGVAKEHDILKPSVGLLVFH